MIQSLNDSIISASSSIDEHPLSLPRTLKMAKEMCTPYTMPAIGPCSKDLENSPRSR